MSDIVVINKANPTTVVVSGARGPQGLPGDVGGTVTWSNVTSKPDATASSDGVMTAEYAAKLDGIAVGATANLGTVTAVTGTGAISSTGGTTPELSIAAASTSVPGTMSAADKTKLDGIEANANAYTHPTTDGNLHVPATGTTNSGKVLTAGATAGALSWETPSTGGGGGSGTVTEVTGTAPVSVATGTTTPAISMAAATASADGYMTKEFASKLDGVAAGATANLGTVTAVTGAGAISSTGGTTPEISIAAATTLVPGTMSAADKTKLDGVAASANNYAHPNHSGDVTSVADGATTIAAKAVTLAKMADVASGSVFYRKTEEAGAPEVQTLATLKTDLGLTGTNSGDQTSVSGNAGTATKLATARAINGVDFDGSAAITIYDSTKEPADATILKSAAIGVSVQAYDADIPTVAASQAEMEAGTEATLRSMSPLRVAQAIAALAEGGGGGLTQTAIKTSAYTPVASELVRLDSAAGAFTVTLPAAPTDKDVIGFLDVTSSCGTNAVLIAAAGSKTVEGDSTGLALDVAGAYVELTYDSAGGNWKAVETPANRLASVVVAPGSFMKYGATTIKGVKGGYGGINFRDAADANIGTLMVSSVYNGWYNAADSNWSWYCTNAGDFLATGNVTAYSDERVKTNWRSFDESFIARLAGVKNGVYDRTDKDLTQVGVSAQSLRTVMPDAVLEGEDGTLSVAYGNAALAACVELAKQVVALTKRLELLEAPK